MRISVKRTIRDFKAAEIWHIEIITNVEDWWFLTTHKPEEPIGEAVETHLKLLKERTKKEGINLTDQLL